MTGGAEVFGATHDATVEVLSADLARLEPDVPEDDRRTGRLGRVARNGLCRLRSARLHGRRSPSGSASSRLRHPAWRAAPAPGPATRRGECPTSSFPRGEAPSRGGDARLRPRRSGHRGDLDLEIRKFDGSRFGVGDYVVRVAPAEGTVCARGTLLPRSRQAVLRRQLLRGRAQLDWARGPGTPRLVRHGRPYPWPRIGFDPRDGAQGAWWFSGRVVVERSCRRGDEPASNRSCSPPGWFVARP